MEKESESSMVKEACNMIVKTVFVEDEKPGASTSLIDIPTQNGLKYKVASIPKAFGGIQHRVKWAHRMVQSNLPRS